MRLNLIMDHIRRTASVRDYYSVPAGVLQIEKLTEYFADAETRAAKRRRLGVENPDDDMLDADCDVVDLPANPVYSRIRHSSPAEFTKQHS